MNIGIASPLLLLALFSRVVCPPLLGYDQVLPSHVDPHNHPLGDTPLTGHRNFCDNYKGMPRDYDLCRIRQEDMAKYDQCIYHKEHSGVPHQKFKCFEDNFVRELPKIDNLCQRPPNLVPKPNRSEAYQPFPKFRGNRMLGKRKQTKSSKRKEKPAYQYVH